MTQRRPRSRSRIILAPRDDGDLFEPLLVLLDDAALIFGVPPSEVRRMIDRRQIEAVHLEGGRVAVKARSMTNVCGERVLIVRNPKRAHELDGTPFPAEATA